MVLCHIGLILSVFVAISHNPAVQLFTHSLQSLPTVTRSPPEILIMSKRTAKMLPVLSQFSPVPFYRPTVQYHVLEYPKPMHFTHTVCSCIRMSHRIGLLNPSLTLESTLNINCVFCHKNFEKTENFYICNKNELLVYIL